MVWYVCMFVCLYVCVLFTVYFHILKIRKIASTFGCKTHLDFFGDITI